MRRTDRKFLPHFLRALDFVWPHKRYLVFSCVSVVGISVFYTMSLTSIVPFLKIMFTRFETVADWVYRNDTERRLGCSISSDVPQGPLAVGAGQDGLFLKDVSRKGPLAKLAEPGDRIIRIDGRAGDHYAMLRIMSTIPRDTPIEIAVQTDGGEAGMRRAVVKPKPGKGYTPYLAWAANRLPAGRDAIGKVKALAVIMGLLVLIEILGGFCRFFQEYITSLLAQRAMIDIRTRGYRNMLRLPLSWYNSQRGGDTLSRFARDSTVLELGIETLFGKTMREPFKALGVFGLAAYISPYLLLGVLAITPIAAYSIRELGRKIRGAQKRALVAWGGLVDMLGERIEGIRIVKGYNMERREAIKFFRQHRRLMKQQLKIGAIDAAVSPLLEVLGVIAVAGISVAGGYLVFHGRLDAEMFFALIVCVAGVFDPIRKLANVNNRIQTADAAAQRLFDVIDQEPEEPAESRGLLAALPEIRDSIEFRDVSFAYPSNPDRPVLIDINLKVKAGEIIAIVGPNGSGKTTLCSLLMRFYQPLRGQILIDGVDIAAASLRGLRGQIGLVTQDTVIFTDTARANVAYGQRHATDADVLRAARTAYADEFIRDLHTEQGDNVTTGYDAVISSRSISGGQKQRIAIARAVLRDPAILIFDEATSQIDSDSEMKIQQALHKIMHGRTTFVIAHRFTTIAQAHRIVVMDGGRIIAVGTHNTLVESCPLYRTLYETQFRQVG
jgi:subfamily B ATP-binding cassette protein MsbA